MPEFHNDQTVPVFGCRRLISLFYLGVTILLSLTVFHNIVTDTLPQVSDAMPILGTLSLLDPDLCHQIEPNFWRNTR